MSDKIIQNDVSNERLRLLIDSSRQTRENIAKSVGMDTSTITKYYNGDRKLTVDAIKKFAVFFNVSADYLLGLSDAQTADKDLQFVCDYTGLSDSNIKYLHHVMYLFNESYKKYNPEYFYFINFVLKHLAFNLFDSLNRYTSYFEKAQKNSKEFLQFANEISEQVNQETISREKMLELFNKFDEDYRSIRHEYEMYELQEYRTMQLMSNVLMEYFDPYTAKARESLETIDTIYNEIFDIVAENDYELEGDTNGGNTKA